MTNLTQHLVITGATGFVGRHFLHWLLRLDRTIRVTALVRGSNAVSARERLIRLLEQTAVDYGHPIDHEAITKRCMVEPFDLTKPGCGLTLEQLQRLRAQGQPVVWHLAASLNFEESNRDLIEVHNVAGTNALIELAAAVDCLHFAYVSTAYSCGQVSGAVPEALHDTKRGFGNAYERSKCIAENSVVELCSRARMAHSIIRPSIVVGISSTGLPAGSETGLYGFTRELMRLKRALVGGTQPLRIEGDSETEVNLVPVDFVARRMVQLQTTHFAGGPIFHVVSAGGPTAKHATDAIARAVGIPGFRFVAELPADATPLERIVARRTVFYSSYLKHPKRFEVGLGAAAGLSDSDVHRFAANFIRERTRSRSTLTERAITTRDGFVLHTARSERSETLRRESVVLVNAIGMPQAALEKLALRLGSNYDVFAWESRGAPSLEGSLDERSSQFGRHVDDLEDVMTHYGVSRAHLIGWCTGADVALAFLQRHPERVLSYTSLNGGFVGACQMRVPYQRHLELIVRRIARSPAHAQLYWDLMVTASTNGPADSDVTEPLRNALSCLDPDLMHLMGAPLKSPQMLQRYSLLLEHYFDEAPRHIPRLAVPALFVAAHDDAIVPCTASLEVAAAFSNSELYLSPRDGHFAPCVNQDLADWVCSFLGRSGGARRAPRKSTNELSAALVAAAVF